jgi:hypothetical protein
VTRVVADAARVSSRGVDSVQSIVAADQHKWKATMMRAKAGTVPHIIAFIAGTQPAATR